jgi:hypothetical protein
MVWVCFSFFLAWWMGVFAGGFAVFGVQNLVKCVVKRGGFVVKAWLESAANRALRICQLFEIFLWIFRNGDFWVSRRGNRSPVLPVAAG